jgi:hypothetical protein
MTCQDNLTLTDQEIYDNGNCIVIGNAEGLVYALFASDEPLQIRYIGATMYPQRRIREHIGSYCKSSKFVRDWIEEVRVRGAEVQVKVLGKYSVQELNSAEYKWIQFWKQYCYLLNCDFMEGWKF